MILCEYGLVIMFTDRHTEIGLTPRHILVGATQTCMIVHSCNDERYLL